MRISDWSSDVCSSDLAHGDEVAADLRCVVEALRHAGTGKLRDEIGDAHGDHLDSRRAADGAERGMRGGGPSGEDADGGGTVAGAGGQDAVPGHVDRAHRIALAGEIALERAAYVRRADRKSVVEGKRVSVRVGHGGRRKFKKKKK